MSADGSRHPSRLADIRQRTPDTETRALVGSKEDARYDTQGVAARFGRNRGGWLGSTPSRLPRDAPHLQPSQ